MSPAAVAILRAARRFHDGTRHWSVPGAPNVAKRLPAKAGGYWNAPTFAWPHRTRKGGWIIRSVRLDWHRSIAKAAALEIIAGITGDNRSPEQVRLDLYAKHGKTAP